MAKISELKRRGKMYSGSNLSPEQKAYNEAVKRANKRTEYWERRHGVEIELPKAPDEFDPNALNRIENMRWKNKPWINPEPVDGRENILRGIESLINDIMEVDPYLHPRAQAGSSYQFHHDVAVKYRDYIIADIRKAADEDPVAFFYHITKDGTASYITQTAHELYGIYGYRDEAERARMDLLAEVQSYLIFDKLTDEQLNTISTTVPESPFTELQDTGDLPEEWM